MEATGGYEKKAVQMLWAEGAGVAVLNPRGIREFAKSLGLLEKTDRIDAPVIARFAEVKKCEPSVPASAEQQCLKALSRRLQQLSRLAADQKNQRHLVDEPRVLRTFDAVLKVAQAADA
jgi:transposase